MPERLKTALAKFASAFWQGFEEARAQSARSATQPAPLAASPFEGMNVDEIKTVLAEALRGAHDEGMSVEKARVASILTAPNAAQFLELAVDLALGDASGAQAVAVLSRAENDAAKRVGLMKSPLESASSGHVPTIH